MAKKNCALCNNPARMFCESDQASLCWDCDEKVHAANFLVEKHSRTLLCHVCGSTTAWKAAGTGLRPAVTVCQDCAVNGEDLESRDDSQESESDDGGDYSEEEEDEEEVEEEDEEEDEEDGENQVVPWSMAETNFTAAASSSGTDEEDGSFSSLKRMRGGVAASADGDDSYESEDEEDGDGCCSSPNRNSSKKNCDYSANKLLRPMKLRRIANHDALSSPEQVVVNGRIPAKSSFGTAAIVDKLQRFQQEIITEEGNS